MKENIKQIGLKRKIPPTERSGIMVYMNLANCREQHCFDLSGLFSAVGDRQEARSFQ